MLVKIDFNTFRLRYLLTTNTVFVEEDDNVWNFYTQDKFIIVKCTVEKSEKVEENIMFIERLTNSGHQQNIIKVIEADDGYGNKEKEVPQIEETEYPDAQDNSSEQDEETQPV